MADLCTCQRPGVEAAADYITLDWPDDAQGRVARNLYQLAADRIRALLTTPGQPCPRCEVVAAAERYGRAVRDTADCTCGDDGGCGPCPTCIEADEAKIALLRAIERMRS